MKTARHTLTATKDGKTQTHPNLTFKQLSKLHHKLAKQGWTVTATGSR